MDLNTLSFVLSVVGLLLGFISAYAKIKNFSLRALKAGSESAERWLRRMDAEADFFIAYPSALIAHVTRSAIILLTLLAIGVVILRPGSEISLPIPEWAASSLRLLFGFFFGNTLASLASTGRQVVRRAKQRHRRPQGDV